MPAFEYRKHSKYREKSLATQPGVDTNRHTAQPAIEKDIAMRDRLGYRDRRGQARSRSLTLNSRGLPPPRAHLRSSRPCTIRSVSSPASCHVRRGSFPRRTRRTSAVIARPDVVEIGVIARNLPRAAAAVGPASTVLTIVWSRPCAHVSVNAESPCMLARPNPPRPANRPSPTRWRPCGRSPRIRADDASPSMF